MDVEGFETEVLAGAREALASPELEATIVELNGSGARYGFDERALHERICAAGFSAHGYDPIERRLHALPRPNAVANTIYLRDPAAAANALASAPSFRVLGVDV